MPEAAHRMVKTGRVFLNEVISTGHEVDDPKEWTYLVLGVSTVYEDMQAMLKTFEDADAAIVPLAQKAMAVLRSTSSRLDWPADKKEELDEILRIMDTIINEETKQ